MKNNKLGFSLAEILVCIGIVAVIATMGFSITKQSVDRAYDLYIYNGYNSILQAFEEVMLRHNINISSSDKFTVLGQLFDTPIISSLKLSDKGKDLVEILSVKEDDVIKTHSLGTEASIEFTTPNGIKYKLEDKMITLVSYYLYVTITVPSRPYYEDGKRKNTKSYKFVYVPSEWPGILVPANDDSSNIETRKDLLPFYIEDGFEGWKDHDGNYNPYTYYSLQEAIYAKYGEINNTTFYVVNSTCKYEVKSTELNNNLKKSKPHGIIKLANPRKIY